VDKLRRLEVYACEAKLQRRAVQQATEKPSMLSQLPYPSLYDIEGFEKRLEAREHEKGLEEKATKRSGAAAKAALKTAQRPARAQKRILSKHAAAAAPKHAQRRDRPRVSRGRRGA